MFKKCSILGAIIALFLGNTALSDGPASPPANHSTPTPFAVSGPACVVDDLTTWRARLAAYFDERQLGLNDLQILYGNCKDPRARLDFQQKIQDFKRETELGWLGLQLQRARENGREREAVFLEQAIDIMSKNGSSSKSKAPTAPKVKYEKGR